MTFDEAFTLLLGHEGGYRSLEENQRVEFDIAQGPKGLQAENIQPL